MIPATTTSTSTSSTGRCKKRQRLQQKNYPYVSSNNFYTSTTTRTTTGTTINNYNNNNNNNNNSTITGSIWLVPTTGRTYGCFIYYSLTTLLLANNKVIAFQPFFTGRQQQQLQKQQNQYDHLTITMQHLNNIKNNYYRHGYERTRIQQKSLSMSLFHNNPFDLRRIRRTNFGKNNDINDTKRQQQQQQIDTCNANRKLSLKMNLVPMEEEGGGVEPIHVEITDTSSTDDSTSTDRTVNGNGNGSGNDVLIINDEVVQSSSLSSSSNTFERRRRRRNGEYFVSRIESNTTSGSNDNYNNNNNDDEYYLNEDGVDPFDEDIVLDDDYNNSKNCYSNSQNKGGYTCAINYNAIDRPYVSRMDSISTFVEYSDNDTVVIPAGIIGQLKETTACWLRQPLVELTSCIFVILNCYLIALSTLPSFILYEGILLDLENIISTFLLIEVLGSWWSSSSEQYKYIFRIQFVIDIVVIVIPLLFVLLPINTLYILSNILPGWLMNPSTLLNLKLLRVLRISRVLQDTTTFTKFISALGYSSYNNASSTRTIQEWQLQLARVLLSLLTLLSIASGLIYTTEHNVNEQFSDYFTTLYFGLTTLTTVGFGDITPITWQGRLVVSGSILIGIAIIPAQAALLIDALLSRQESIRSSSISSSTSSSNNNSINGSRNSINRKKLTDASSSTGSSKRLLQQQSSNIPSQMILETTMTCTECGATMHWNNAKFCWSCGSPI